MTDERLPGVVGVEIAGLRERIRPQWFHDFLLDPASWKRRTRMPTFFPKGVSTRPDLLEGDVEKQIASLWWYLAEISDTPLPPKLAADRTNNFELVPGDDPIVLRTFFAGVGTHAICVGLPRRPEATGLNFAFDGREQRFAVVWKGRFLDAHGTWYDRFVPPAEPLGSDVLTLTSGPGVHASAEASPWPETVAGLRFRGYKLSNGIPTFRYQLGNVEVHDRLDAVGNGLRRHIHVTRSDDRPLWIQLAQGANVETRGDEVQIDRLTLHGAAIKRTITVGTELKRVVLRLNNEPVTIDYTW